jgi:hypothetical protein
MQKQNQNWLSPDFDKQSASKALKYFVNKTKKEYIASKITQTETIEPKGIKFLGFKPKPKIYFSRPDQI